MSARDELDRLRAEDDLARYRRSRARRERARLGARKVARYALWFTPIGLINEAADGGWFKDDE